MPQRSLRRPTARSEVDNQGRQPGHHRTKSGGREQAREKTAQRKTVALALISFESMAAHRISISWRYNPKHHTILSPEGQGRLPGNKGRTQVDVGETGVQSPGLALPLAQIPSSTVNPWCPQPGQKLILLSHMPHCWVRRS